MIGRGKFLRKVFYLYFFQCGPVKVVIFIQFSAVSFCLSDLLLISVTECPFCTNSYASGLLICPKEPASIIFIFLLLLIQSYSEKEKLTQSNLLRPSFKLKFVLV